MENIRSQLNAFCSLTQEVHEKINDIETIKSQVRQAADKIYAVQDNVEELNKGTFMNNTTVSSQHEEYTLMSEITQLKRYMEDLKNLNTETH